MLQKNIIILVLGHFFMPTDQAVIPMRDDKGRLSLVEWSDYNYREPEGYGTYAFGYDIEDPENNNVQFRNEEKLSNGSVVGSYGYLEPAGDVFLVTYIADERGYRAKIERPLKLSFLRPTGEKDSKQWGKNSHKSESNSEEPKAPLDSRIVTPDENKSNQTSNGPSQNFNSVEESNAFYYPQNILESADFHRPENVSDQILFPRKSDSSLVEHKEENTNEISEDSFSSVADLKNGKSSTSGEAMLALKKKLFHGRLK